MYTVRLAINTSDYDNRFFEKCFYYGCVISNLVTRHANNALTSLSRMREYKVAREKYGRRYAGKKAKELNKEQKAERECLIKIMNNYQMRYPLTANALEKYARVARQQYTNYLSSHQVQWIADQVAKSVKDYLYGNGKQLHFCKNEQFITIGQKAADDGVTFLNWHKIRFMKCIFYLDVPSTPYMQAVIAQHDKVKIISLKRIEFNSRWKYYAIITLDGDPPIMHKKSEEQNAVGIDIGTSTYAAESNKFVKLENLAPDTSKYEKQIRHLQNLIDHKLRVANPDNYDSLGRARKGRHRWVISKKVKQVQRKVRVLYRKESMYIKCSHRRQINQLLENSSTVVIEPMQFRHLQKRSKKMARQEKLSTIKKKDGSTIQVKKFKRKKRFGHSIKNRSPSFFQSELKRRATLYGIPFVQIDTAKYKASQLHHDTGEYIKSSLNERYKTISGCKVQRDLYSAFLIRHSDSSLCRPDFETCNADFRHFAETQDALLSEMRANKISNIPCWGF
jgi:hypothetical protein